MAADCSVLNYGLASCATCWLIVGTAPPDPVNRSHLLQQINTQQVICAGRSLIYVREVQAHSEEADIHPYVISVKLKVWESQQRQVIPQSGIHQIPRKTLVRIICTKKPHVQRLESMGLG